LVGLSSALAISGVVFATTASLKALSLVLGVGGLAAPGLLKLGGNLGLVAAGMAKMLGPVAMLVGILAYFHPDKATLDKRLSDAQANPLGMGKDSPAEKLWDWLTGAKKPDGTSGGGAPSAPNPIAAAARGDAAAPDHKGLYDAIVGAIKDGFAGIGVEIDGHAIGRAIMGGGPPTDSGSQFDGRMHPAYPTGGGTN
jgi:hypothetical protein